MSARTKICVTITRDRTMPGHPFLITTIFSDGYRIGNRSAGLTAQEAAATAINGAGKMRGFCKIVAPPEVMAFIPAIVRARMR